MFRNNNYYFIKDSNSWPKNKEENLSFNAPNETIVVTSEALYEECCKCEIKKGEFSYSLNYPNCITIKFNESPTYINSSQFDSMQKLQNLEITQDLSKDPIPDTLGDIPSEDLSKI